MFVSKRLAQAASLTLGLMSALMFTLISTQAAADPIVIEEHPLSASDAPPAPPPPALTAAATDSPTASPATAPAVTSNSGTGGGSGTSTWQLYQQVQDLQQQVQTLQGTVDEQSHTIERLRNDDKSRYTDLDQRLNSLNDRMGQLQQGGTAATATSGAPAAVTSAAPSGDIDAEKKSYLAAYDIFRAQGPDKAIPPMLAFVGRYPNSIFTPNAYYWLGEFYLAATPSNPAEARRHFETVLTTYPNSAKAPAALYKLGTIDDLQNHPDAAKKRMQDLIQRFPNSPEANLAKSYLNPPAADSSDDTPSPVKKKKTGG